jgi:putative solute:sodium symporter small subunit
MPLTGQVADFAVAPAPGDPRRRYWRRVRWLTVVLLSLWLLAGFGVIFEARALSFRFFGWPFGYWWAAQGALLVFLALVAVYALAAERLDRLHGLQEER